MLVVLYFRDCADDYQEDDKSRVELHDEFERRAFGFARTYPSLNRPISGLRSSVDPTARPLLPAIMVK